MCISILWKAENCFIFSISGRERALLEKSENSLGISKKLPKFQIFLFIGTVLSTPSLNNLTTVQCSHRLFDFLGLFHRIILDEIIREFHALGVGNLLITYQNKLVLPNLIVFSKMRKHKQKTTLPKMYETTFSGNLHQDS